jgi:hypothetical protein
MAPKKADKGWTFNTATKVFEAPAAPKEDLKKEIPGDSITDQQPAEQENSN